MAGDDEPDEDEVSASPDPNSAPPPSAAETSELGDTPPEESDDAAARLTRAGLLLGTYGPKTNPAQQGAPAQRPGAEAPREASGSRPPPPGGPSAAGTSGGPQRPGGSEEPVTIPWWLLAAALLALLGVAYFLRAHGSPPVVTPPATASCSTGDPSDAWASLRPAPDPNGCLLVSSGNPDRNKSQSALIASWQGSSLVLDGRHHTYAIFVDVGLQTHSPDQRAWLLDRTRTALGHLVAVAQTYPDNCLSFSLTEVLGAPTIPLVLQQGRPFLPVEYFEEPLAAAITASDPMLHPRGQSLHDIWEAAMNAHGVSSVSFLFFVPTPGRSYALRLLSASPEYTILFTPASELNHSGRANAEATIAHEFMHLVGADDLYAVTTAANYHQRSLMNELCFTLLSADIDPFSAYAVGLGDGYHPGNPLPPTPFPIIDQRGLFTAVR